MPGSVAERVGELLVQVNALYGAGQYRKAIEIATAARDLAASDPAAADMLAGTCSWLGGLHAAVGDYAAAESAARQGLSIYRRVLGNDHPYVAATLNKLAEIVWRKGDYAQAESLYRQALEMRERLLGPVHPEVADSLNNLAQLYQDRGDFAAAEPLVRRASDIYREALGEDHPFFAASLNNLARLYEQLGRYSLVVPLYEQALAIWRRAVGEDHPDVATCLNNLASHYSAAGNYPAAESLLREALEIRERRLGADHPAVAASLTSLGYLYFTLGDYAEAEPSYRRALAITKGRLGPDNPAVASRLNGLAGVLEATGNRAEAESLYQEAIAVLRKSVGPEAPAVAQNLNDLASLYGTMGRYAEAEPLLQEALTIGQKHLGDDSPKLAVYLDNLGRIHADQGDYAAAEPLYRRALEGVQKAAGEEPIVSALLGNLAKLCLATGRAEEALALMQERAPLENKLLEQAFTIGSERRRAAYLELCRRNDHLLLTIVTRLLPSSRAAAQTALDHVLQRKAIGTEALAVQRDAMLADRYTALAPELSELSALRAQIAQKALAGPGAEGVEAHRRTLAEWGARREQLEEELVRKIPEMSLEKALANATRAAVAAALPAEAALIEIVCFMPWSPPSPDAAPVASRYLALVLHAGDPESVERVDLGDASTIDALVARFRSSLAANANDRDLLADDAPPADDGESGELLRAAVFDPLVGALRGCRRLFLAPDAELCTLPFEVLPLGDRRLVDDYHLSYLSTGRDLLRFGARPGIPATEPVVIANPDFDLAASTSGVTPAALPERQSRDLARATGRFEPLPGTGEEGARVAERLGVHPWLGADAVEGRLKSRRSPRVLHIATHGFFLADEADSHAASATGFERLSATTLEDPLLRSGLALAGANTWRAHGALPPEAEDGILNAADVAQLDLSATELAVLSACETGLGELRRGDGVHGLRRAFVVAGAQTLVMSLWKVPDRETANLMATFYEGLARGLPRSQALREAQLAVRAERPDPYFWGAFICQGDPGPLSRVAPQ